MLLPVDIEARSELVGVHDSLGYEGALPGTTQASWCSSAESGGRQELSRARYPAQQAKQPADVEQARGNRSSDSQQERDRLALRITAFMRCIVFVSARKSQGCDHKNIACYQERTAKTSLNRQRHEQHKKAVIWQEIAGGKQDIFG